MVPAASIKFYSVVANSIFAKDNLGFFSSHRILLADCLVEAR